MYFSVAFTHTLRCALLHCAGKMILVFLQQRAAQLSLETATHSIALQRTAQQRAAHV